MQKPLRTLIVENKQTDLKALQGFLKKHEAFIEIAAIAKSYQEALDIFSKDGFDGFDASILDYDLGKGKNSFQLLNIINRKKFGILSVTTKFKEAVFDIHLMMDSPLLLPKPFGQEVVDLFIIKLREEWETLEMKLNKTFTLNNNGVYSRLLYKNIYFIEGDDKYCKVYFRRDTSDTEFVASPHYEKLKEVEIQLDPRIFYNCHRCYIVNVHNIIYCQKSGRGAEILFRKNDEFTDSNLALKARASSDGRMQLTKWGFMME